MKKIIYVVILTMMLLPSMANAQDAWKPQTPTKSLNFRMGKAEIHRKGRIYIISLITDFSLNVEVISIYLGNGRQEALETINKLIEISEFPSCNIYPYKDINFQICDNHLRIKEVKDKWYWGTAYLYDRELKKMKAFIEKGK